MLHSDNGGINLKKKKKLEYNQTPRPINQLTRNMKAEHVK